MDNLDEEEQLRAIYCKSTPKKVVHDDVISHSSTTMTLTTGRFMEENWQQIRLYILYKIVQCLFLGAVIFWQNDRKQNGLTSSLDDGIYPQDTPQQYCCQCYEHAKEQMDSDYPRRVDWSYCTKCWNCTACALHSNTPSFHEDHCEGTKGLYDGHPAECTQYEADDIERYLSDTTMGIFYKNYHQYGIGALVC